MSDEVESEPEADDEAAASPSFENRLIDQVVPDELDWVDLVRTYPLTALLVSAAAGFYIGRVHGERLIEAATEMTDRRMKETADRLAGAAEDAFG